MAESAHEDNPQDKAQVDAAGDSGEYLYSMKDNPDKRHNQDHQRLDHSVASFLDQPIKLDDAMEISAHALAEPIEAVAESLDRLVLSGRLLLREGVLFPAAADSYSNQIEDVYNERSRPRSSGQEPLDVSAEEGEEPKPKPKYQPPSEEEIKQMYEQWMEMVKRHPEWRAKLSKQRPMKIDINDPSGTMKGLKDVFQYDPESVKPEEKLEFEQFLKIDQQIEAFENWQQEQGGGMTKEQSLRCVARYRMLGGRDPNLGLVRRGSRLLILRTAKRATIASQLDDAANEMAYAHYGSGLETLPQEKQLELMERAEKQMLDKEPILREALDDGSPPPAPDPEKAPSGWEKIVDETGQESWRSKDNPGVKLEQPEGGY